MFDLDVLVRPSDLQRATQVLIADGYRLIHQAHATDGIRFHPGRELSEAIQRGTKP
jgi:hypothetical protein